MKKIEKLKMRREHDGCHQKVNVYPSTGEIMKKINELIDYVAWLERKHLPVASLDDPEENCRVCDHMHELICECGCPAERVKKDI